MWKISEYQKKIKKLKRNKQKWTYDCFYENKICIIKKKLFLYYL